MNNIYLFRAKRIDNGEWVEGYLVETRHNTYHDGYRIIDKNGINYDELDYYEPSFISYVIDKTTICQCTGLKDKNGNLVWENDVVRIKYDDDFSVVGWIKYSNCGVRYNFVFGTEIYGIDDSCDIEVIGNIFDNPELINE